MRCVSACLLQVAPWKRIVLTRSVALAPTLLVALLAGSPNKLDVLNQWLNVLQSIQLPFAIVPVSAACTRAEPWVCADISACCRVGAQRRLGCLLVWSSASATMQGTMHGDMRQPVADFLLMLCDKQVITLTSSRRIMGPHFVNSLATQLGAWVVASFIVSVNGCAHLPVVVLRMRAAAEVCALSPALLPCAMLMQVLGVRGSGAAPVRTAVGNCWRRLCCGDVPQLRRLARHRAAAKGTQKGSAQRAGSIQQRRQGAAAEWAADA